MTVRWAVGVGGLAAAAVALVLGLVNGLGPVALSHLIYAAACVLIGTIIVAHRPRNAVGGLLLTAGLSFTALDFCGQLALWRPELTLLAWPQNFLWVPANLALAAIPFCFPDRPLPAPRLVVPAVVLAALPCAFAPGANQQLGYGVALPNPLGIEALAGLAAFVEPAITVVAALLFVAGAADLARRARRIERAQVQWLVYALSVAGVVVVLRLTAGLTDDLPNVIWPLDSGFWELAGTAAITLVLAAIGIAIVRHGLFDVELVINRTLVYAVLTAFVTGGYVAVVGYLGAVFESRGLPQSVAAAAVVALVFAPLRARVQRAVNVLMYGRRDDPYAALAHLGRSLETRPDAQAAAASVAEALKLPHAAVELPGQAGDPGLVRLPLTYQNELVGHLALAPRPGQREFGARDLRLLRDLARQMGSVVHAERLAADLRASRERLVVAREEERRRLRRDLHDGLGPTLAALTMRAEAVQDLVNDPRAQDLLEEMIGAAQAATADVRALIDGLRPPALDTLGLLGALRAHVAGLPGEPQVGLDLPADLPELSAATEVAAYHIAVEAINNARRHSGAGTVTLRLVPWKNLLVEVVDDGRGVQGPPGIGLNSLRERAVELGGSFAVITARGTTVRAQLPMGA
ncbi:sensor histidine kinase [Herbidospora daliensis]|uniref:sensor histidine kinase n=1 Tax=Herbidospora daliensis TaxID=295585 RepID=UPI000A05BE0E|nr:histidine kinase [Herbidospora daliensis]